MRRPQRRLLHARRRRSTNTLLRETLRHYDETRVTVVVLANGAPAGCLIERHRTEARVQDQQAFAASSRLGFHCLHEAPANTWTLPPGMHEDGVDLIRTQTWGPDDSIAVHGYKRPELLRE